MPQTYIKSVAVAKFKLQKLGTCLTCM